MTPRAIKWTNSTLTTLQQCGERFRRRYLEGERVPPSPRQIRGTVVHAMARMAHRRQLADVPAFTREEATDTAATEFETLWRAGVVLSRDEESAGAVAVEAVTKDAAVDLSAYHVETVAPKITPRAVERHINVRPADSAIEIAGTLDLVEVLADGREGIRDLKTSEKSPRGDAAETSQQLTMYALVRQAEALAIARDEGRELAPDDALPAGLALDFVVRTPAQHRKSHQVLRTTRTAEDTAALVERINAGVRAVERGVFVPANPDAWYCAEAYCEYFSTCPYVRRGTSRPTT